MAESSEPLQLRLLKNEHSNITIQDVNDVKVLYDNDTGLIDSNILEDDSDIKTLKENNLSLTYIKYDKRGFESFDTLTNSGAMVHECERVVFLSDSEIRGEFRISGTNWVSLDESDSKKYDSFNGRTSSMGINLDDTLQKKGLSRIIIKYMIKILQNKGISDHQKLFIDGDGSGGFWDSIGMRENPYGYDFKNNMFVDSNYKHTRTIIEGEKKKTVTFIEGKGYEKVITVKELYDWANKNKIVNTVLQKRKLNNEHKSNSEHKSKKHTTRKIKK